MRWNGCSCKRAYGKSCDSGDHARWPVSGIFSVISQLFLNYFSFPSYFSLISLKFPSYFSVTFHFLLISHLFLIYFSLLTCFSLISQLFLDFLLASPVFLTCFSLISQLFLIYVFAKCHLLPDLLKLSSLKALIMIFE